MFEFCCGMCVHVWNKSNYSPKKIFGSVNFCHWQRSRKSFTENISRSTVQIYKACCNLPIHGPHSPNPYYIGTKFLGCVEQLRGWTDRAPESLRVQVNIDGFDSNAQEKSTRKEQAVTAEPAVTITLHTCTPLRRTVDHTQSYSFPRVH